MGGSTSEISITLGEELAERLFELVGSICNDQEEYIRAEREEGASEEDLSAHVEDLEVYGEVWQRLKRALGR